MWDCYYFVLLTHHHTRKRPCHTRHIQSVHFHKTGADTRTQSGDEWWVLFIENSLGQCGCVIARLLSEHLNVENHLGSIKIHWHRGVISSSLIWSFLFTPCIKRPSSHPELFSLTKQRSELRKQCRLSNDNKTMIAGDGQLRSLRALEIPGAGGGC